jgi:aspartate aminotransferase
MVSMEMYELGAKSSVIREIFEFGKKRAAEIGRENVYDYSLGNPSVPAPAKVNETIRKLTQELSPCELHGYTSAVGDNATRQAIAEISTSASAQTLQ